MMTRQTVTRFLGGCVMLYTVLGVLAPSSLTAASPSDPSAPRAECAEQDHQPEGADSTDHPCAARPTFRSEEELSNRRREEEHGGIHWRLLEPNAHDLDLWYYPGAPHPLWGY